MKQIKIFSSKNLIEIEQQVNEFLNDEERVIHNVDTENNRETLIIIITYSTL